MTGRTPTSASAPRVAAAAAASCQLIDRPGSVQADVRLGRFTIDRADPRWADLQLAVHALGGAFLSRLNNVLREEKGYTYGVHAVNVPLRAGGYTLGPGLLPQRGRRRTPSPLMPGLLDVGLAPDHGRRGRAAPAPT